MARVWELLDKAYSLIEKDRCNDAQNVLEEILRTDPQNVEAWDAYIRSCSTRNQLEELRDHITDTWESRVQDDFLFATRRFVLQRLNERMKGI